MGPINITTQIVQIAFTVPAPAPRVPKHLPCCGIQRPYPIAMNPDNTAAGQHRRIGKDPLPPPELLPAGRIQGKKGVGGTGRPGRCAYIKYASFNNGSCIGRIGECIWVKTSQKFKWVKVICTDNSFHIFRLPYIQNTIQIRSFITAGINADYVHIAVQAQSIQGGTVADGNKPIRNSPNTSGIVKREAVGNFSLPQWSTGFDVPS